MEPPAPSPHMHRGNLSQARLTACALSTPVHQRLSRFRSMDILSQSLPTISFQFSLTRPSQLPLVSASELMSSLLRTKHRVATGCVHSILLVGTPTDPTAAVLFTIPAQIPALLLPPP